MCDMFLRNAIYLPSANVEVSAMLLNITTYGLHLIRQPYGCHLPLKGKAIIFQKGLQHEHYK